MQRASYLPVTPSAYRYSGAIDEQQQRFSSFVARLTHAIDVYDSRPMNSYEASAIETLLEREERLADQMTAFARVNCRVVIIRLYPVNLIGVNYQIALGCRHHDSLLSAFLLASSQQRRQLA